MSTNTNDLNNNKIKRSSFKYLGGIKQNDNISWEASYIDFGSPDDEKSKVNQSTQSYSMGGKFNLFNDSQFKSELKLGLHKWEQDLQEEENTGTNIYYGLVFNIPLSKNTSLTTGYDSYHLNSNIDNFSIGIEYRF